MEDFLNQTFLENYYQDYLWFFIWLAVGFVFQVIFLKTIIKFLVNLFYKHTEKIDINNFHKLLEKPLKLVLFFIFLYLASNHLNWPESWGLDSKESFGIKMIVHRSFFLAFGIIVTYFIIRTADCFTLVMMEKAEKTDTKQDDQLVPFLAEILKIFIWIIAVLVMLNQVFELNVGSLVAGLGIGGLAIALAAQDTLTNLLGSFTIFFDKPFVVGDLVTVGNITGVVEKVGFRSTRIRTLEKSYVTLPNKKMIEAELDNLTLRTYRRVDFNVGLTYDTPSASIKSIVSEIQNYIDHHPNTNEEGKVKFMEFGDSSLNIMVLYYIDTMDWGVFLDIKEEINYKIMELVEKNGSSFAFPSTSVYLENQPFLNKK